MSSHERHSYHTLGNFVGPNETEITDAQRLDFIEEVVRISPTGVSFDWIPSVEGEASGYRFMRHHNIGEPRKSLRGVIDVAIAYRKGQRK